eukprot:938907-Heterocapsa_arctica.AAC.1
MAASAIDTKIKQVLIDFFEDADGFMWPMRLLMIHGGGGKWVAATPDHELEMLDLTEHRVIPLKRQERFPDRVADQVYAFDEFEDGEEDSLLRSAAEYAAAIGFTAPAAPTAAGVWRVSDTAHKLFGEP